jgi:hypothetical protein
MFQQITNKTSTGTPLAKLPFTNPGICQVNSNQTFQDQKFAVKNISVKKMDFFVDNDILDTSNIEIYFFKYLLMFYAQM